MPKGVVDKREAILRAAGKVFAERGYHATGISDIARELGAGHGTFYRYFTNKEHIARSVVARALGQVMDTLSDENPGSSETLPEYREQVRRIGHNLFDLVVAEPALCRILFYDAIAIDRAEPDTAGRAMEAAAAYTAEFIRNGQDRGFLRRDLDAHVVGLAVNGMIVTGAARLLHVQDPDSLRGPWIHTVETLMFHGLGSS
ncbi:TetR/AcrR family transcriptional regulator [Streptomyces sp. NPDC004647]|uniref:TetR/AcrR family transcriptional regulator n=1 Tax=Streptomyces sp. NPDC004647 TaxID=3154671 RepID=UPI0033A041A2